MSFRNLIVFLLFFNLALFAAAANGEQPASQEDELPGDQAGSRSGKHFPFRLVQFRSGSLTLYGALRKPAGDGPFPCVIYNHGSEPRVALVAAPQLGYGNVARLYVDRGFVFFVPLRRGHEFGFNLKPIARSEGELLGDRVNKQAGPYADKHARNMIFLREQEIDNDDVEAGVGWLKSQPFVDKTRMIMSGISFGGIQTTLAAERNLGMKAFIPFAPGAMSWASCPELHEREKQAMLHAKAPIFLIQANNDYNTGPSEYLGKVLDGKGPPNQHKLYPDFMPELGHRAGHGGFALWPGGIAIWSPDVLPFIQKMFAQ